MHALSGLEAPPSTIDIITPITYQECMKNHPAWIVLVFTFALASHAFAGFELPKKVYPLEKLEDARAEATTKGKNLAFLYTDVTTDCGLCRQASLVFVDELDSKAVIVNLPYKNKDAWPKEVRAANQADTGKYIPKIFVFSPDLSEFKTSVNYDAFKAEGNKAVRQAKKALK